MIKHGRRNKANSHNLNMWIGRIAYVVAPYTKRRPHGGTVTRHRFALTVTVAVYNAWNDEWYERSELIRFMEWWREDQHQESFKYEVGDLVMVTAIVRDRQLRRVIMCEQCNHPNKEKKPYPWFEVLNIQRLEANWVREERKARKARKLAAEAAQAAINAEVSGGVSENPGGHPLLSSDSDPERLPEQLQPSEQSDLETQAPDERDDPAICADPYAGYSVDVRQQSAAFANALHKQREPTKAEQELQRLRDSLG